MGAMDLAALASLGGGRLGGNFLTGFVPKSLPTYVEGY